MLSFIYAYMRDEILLFIFIYGVALFQSLHYLRVWVHAVEVISNSLCILFSDYCGVYVAELCCCCCLGQKEELNVSGNLLNDD